MSETSNLNMIAFNTVKTLTPFNRWLIKQRQWCERCSDLTPATVVRNYNGRDTVMCSEHAGRLDAARISEKRQEDFKSLALKTNTLRQIVGVGTSDSSGKGQPL